MTSRWVDVVLNTFALRDVFHDSYRVASLLPFQQLLQQPFRQLGEILLGF